MMCSRCLPLLSALTFAACSRPAPDPAATSPREASAPPSAAAPASAAQAPAPPSAPVHLTSRAVPIPGVTPPLSFDYLVADRSAGRVYLALSNGGSLQVFDVASGAFLRVDGFKTAEKEAKEGKGKKRLFGPSAATVGDGVVYVGNRATSEICTVDAKSLQLGTCLQLPTPPDGVQYVAAARELWVTTPKDQSITVLDASRPGALTPKTVIKLAGEPEGYAVDAARGLFLTNLEDKGSTLAIDVKTHQLRATWNASCGSDGPRGIAVDGARGLVFVACTDHVQVLDGAHDGALLGRFDTGAGVDNLDYVDASGLLYAAAGKAARLTVARFDAKGIPTIVADGATAAGARNAVADGKGRAFVPDPSAGALLVIEEGK